MAKEIAKSLYEITAKLDTTNLITGKVFSDACPVNEVTVKLKDPHSVEDGDYISFYTEAIVFENSELKAPDDSTIGRLSYISQDYYGRSLAEQFSDKESPNYNPLFEEMTRETAGAHNRLHRLIFNNKVKTYDTLTFIVKQANYTLIASSDKSVTATASLSDVDKNVIASLEYLTPSQPPLTSGSHLSVAQNGIYTNLNDITNSYLYPVITGVTNDESTLYLKKGNKIRWLLDDDRFIFKFDHINNDSSKYDEDTAIYTSDKPTGTIPVPELQNKHGIWGANNKAFRFKVLKNTDTEYIIELIDDIYRASYLSLATYSVYPKEYNETTVNSSTGAMLSLPTLHSSIIAPNGDILYSNTFSTNQNLVGKWTSSDGTIIPRYITQLKAVTESGIVLNESLASTTLLKEGEPYSLEATPTITIDDTTYDIVGNTTYSGNQLAKTTVINVVYKERPKVVITRALYVTENNETLLDKLESLKVGSHYSFPTEYFADYSFLRVEGNPSGTVPANGVEVKFIYTSKSKGSCVNCDCPDTGCGSANCVKLHDLNDSKLLSSAKIIANSALCDLAKNTAKGFKNIYCVLKNIINNICCLNKRMDCAEAKMDNLCSVIKCEDNRITNLYNFLMNEALKNVSFSMKSQGTETGVGTYTRVATKADGSFTVNWNMVLGGGVVVGNGSFSGTVHHVYTLNKNGSIHAVIGGVTFTNISYQPTGYASGSSSASFQIIAPDGNTAFSKSYDPFVGWSANVNSINFKHERDLQPLGGDSGDLLMFKTVDTWITSPTYSNVTAKFVNNNSPLPEDSPCKITCDKC